MDQKAVSDKEIGGQVLDGVRYRVGGRI